MNKKYIVENLEFDTKFKTEKEIMPNLARTSRSYLFTTKRFPKTWPAARGGPPTIF